MDIALLASRAWAAFMGEQVLSTCPKLCMIGIQTLLEVWCVA